MIVITTPTGQIGRQILGNVLAAGEPARIIVRDPAKLPPEVRDRVEVVEGSHSDPDVVGRAFAGADALFWLAPPDFQASSLDTAYTGFARPAAEAIRECGLKRVVSVSALGRGTPYARQAGLVTATLAMNDLIAGSGVAFRGLALPGFMDNLLRQVAPIRDQGAFFDIIAPDHKEPAVATRDIAAVAARLLLDASWTGQEEVPLLGPEEVSYTDRAAIVSEVLGKPVRYQQIPEQALEDRLRGAGASEALVRGMVDMIHAKEQGLDAGVVRTPQHAVETPTTFQKWCEDVLKPAVESADGTSRAGHGG